jgi:hypothetical protein
MRQIGITIFSLVQPSCQHRLISRKPQRRGNPQGPICYCRGLTARYKRVDGQ